MSSREDVVLVGAVAYHPRIVTIWEGFRPYFAAQETPDRLRALLELRTPGRRAARRRGGHRLEHEHRLRGGGGADRRRRAGSGNARRGRGLPHRDRHPARRGVRLADRACRKATRARQPGLGSRGDPAPLLPRPGRPRRRPGRHARSVRHRPGQARRHRRLGAPGRPGRRRRRGGRGCDRRRDLGGDAVGRLRSSSRARDLVAEPDLLPLQLHRAARVRRGSGSSLEPRPCSR